MTKRASIQGFLDSKQPAEEDPKTLMLTPMTIRFGHNSQIFQLRNITRIGKYFVLEKRFPEWAIFILIAMSFISFFAKNGYVFSIPMMLVAAYGIYNRTRPKKFALGFETNSGSMHFLYAKDEIFINKIIEIISNYMEKEQSSGVVINIEDRSIKNSGEIFGNINTGDIK